MGWQDEETSKEWRVNARMTYDKEFGLLEDRALKRAHNNDAYSDCECEEAAGFVRILSSRLVKYYRDD